MKAKCWKCETIFSFDESKLKASALFSCKACSEKTAIRRNPESGQITFHPYRPNKPKPEIREASKKADSRQPLSSTLKSKSANSQDTFSGTYAFPGPGASKKPAKNDPPSIHHGDLHSWQQEQSLIDGKLGFDRGEALELVGDGENPARQPEPFPELDKPKETRPPDTVDQNSPPQMAPRTRRNGQIRFNSSGSGASRLMNVVILLSFLVLVAVALHLFAPQVFDELLLKSEKKDEPSALHKGEQYLLTLVQKAGAVDGDPMVMIKQAELEYDKDISTGYQKAHDLFNRALVLDQKNAELMVRYVESFCRLSRKPVRISLVRDLLDLLDYAGTLSPGLAVIHRAKARLYMLIEQREKAQKQAEMAVRLEEKNLESLELLAVTLMDHNPRHALDILNTVIDDPKVLKSTYLPLAQLYVNMGRYAEAEKVFGMREKVDPDTCALCEPLAKMYESIGIYSKAEEVYALLQAKWPENENAVLGMARVKWMAGLPPIQSSKILDDVSLETLDEFTDQGRVRVLCAKSHYSLMDGDFISAKIAASNAFQIDSEMICSRYHYVLTQMSGSGTDLEKMEELLALIESLILDLPDHPQILNLWGEFARNANDLQTAIRKFKRVKALVPDNIHSRLMLGFMYLKAVNPERALAIIEPLLSYSPGYWKAHTRYNLFTEKMDYREDLMNSLEKIDESQVDLDRKHMVLGLVSFLFGDMERALGAFATVLQNNQVHVKANLFRAYVLYEQHKYREAMQHLRIVLSADNEHADANSLFALLYVKTGNKKRAMTMLKKLIRAPDDHADTLVLYSRLLQEYGKKEEAETWARKAYFIDPTSANVRKVLYLTQK